MIEHGRVKTSDIQVWTEFWICFGPKRDEKSSIWCWDLNGWLTQTRWRTSCSFPKHASCFDFSINIGTIFEPCSQQVRRLVGNKHIQPHKIKKTRSSDSSPNKSTQSQLGRFQGQPESRSFGVTCRQSKNVTLSRRSLLRLNTPRSPPPTRSYTFDSLQREGKKNKQ